MKVAGQLRTENRTQRRGIAPWSWLSHRWLCIALGSLLWLGAHSFPAQGLTLQDLVGGASLDVGNSRFSNWKLVDLDATGSTPPNLSIINVVPLIDSPPLNPGLQFVANGQLSTVGINAIDLHLQFRAEALAGSSTFVGQSLAMTGVTFGGDGGILFLTGDLTGGAGQSLGASLAIADHETDFFQLSNSTTFAANSHVLVAMNVFLTGLAPSDTVTLSTFTQRLSQSGPSVLAGDFNRNGVVDAADYVVWRKGLGTIYVAADYDVWRTHFGATSGAGSLSTAVPEPSFASVALAGSAAMWRAWRRRPRRFS